MLLLATENIQFDSARQANRWDNKEKSINHCVNVKNDNMLKDGSVTSVTYDNFNEYDDITISSSDDEEKHKLEEEIRIIEKILHDKLKLEAEIKEIENKLKKANVKDKNRNNNIKKPVNFTGEAQKPQPAETTIEKQEKYVQPSRINAVTSVIVDFNKKHSILRPIVAKHIRSAAARIDAVRKAASAPSRSMIDLKRLPKKARRSSERLMKEAAELPLAEKDDTHLPFYVRCSRVEARKCMHNKVFEVEHRIKVEREVTISQCKKREALVRQRAANEAIIVEGAVKEISIWESMAEDAKSRRNIALESGNLELAEREDVALDIAFTEVQTWVSTARRASFNELEFTKIANREATLTRTL